MHSCAITGGFRHRSSFKLNGTRFNAAKSKEFRTCTHRVHSFVATSGMKKPGQRARAFASVSSIDRLVAAADGFHAAVWSNHLDGSAPAVSVGILIGAVAPIVPTIVIVASVPTIIATITNTNRYARIAQVNALRRCRRCKRNAQQRSQTSNNLKHDVLQGTHSKCLDAVSFLAGEAIVRAIRNTVTDVHLPGDHDDQKQNDASSYVNGAEIHVSGGQIAMPVETSRHSRGRYAFFRFGKKAASGRLIAPVHSRVWVLPPCVHV